MTRVLSKFQIVREAISFSVAIGGFKNYHLAVAETLNPEDKYDFPHLSGLQRHNAP
jgi:hypothetical protein